MYVEAAGRVNHDQSDDRLQFVLSKGTRLQHHGHKRLAGHDQVIQKGFDEVFRFLQARQEKHPGRHARLLPRVTVRAGEGPNRLDGIDLPRLIPDVSAALDLLNADVRGARGEANGHGDHALFLVHSYFISQLRIKVNF